MEAIEALCPFHAIMGPPNRQIIQYIPNMIPLHDYTNL